MSIKMLGQNITSEEITLANKKVTELQQEYAKLYGQQDNIFSPNEQLRCKYFTNIFNNIFTSSNRTIVDLIVLNMLSGRVYIKPDVVKKFIDEYFINELSLDDNDIEHIICMCIKYDLNDDSGYKTKYQFSKKWILRITQYELNYDILYKLITTLNISHLSLMQDSIFNKKIVSLIKNYFLSLNKIYIYSHNYNALDADNNQSLQYISTTVKAFALLYAIYKQDTCNDYYRQQFLNVWEIYLQKVKQTTNNFTNDVITKVLQIYNVKLNNELNNLLNQYR